MNKSAFLNIIRHASAITAGEAEELEELVVNFPYCQTAHLLIAKAAHDRGSMLANQKLRKAAAYATDRQLLRKMVQAPAPTFPLPEEAPVPYLVEPALQWVPLDQEEEMVDHAVEEEYFTPEQPYLETADTPSEALSGYGKEDPAEVVFPTDNPRAAEEHVTLATGEPDTLLHALETENSGPVELADDLDGLLYIDRIFPFRHLVPEHLPIPPVAFPNGTTEDFIANSSGVIDSEPTPYPSASLEDPESDPALIDLLLHPAGGPSPPIDWAPTETPNTLEGWLAEEPLDWNDGEPMADGMGATNGKNKSTAESAGAEAPGEIPAESPAVTPADVPLPVDIFAQIYAQNQLGYAMDSSRLGECLEVKQELTASRPFQFYPDLILEYLQEHEMEMEDQVPVDSILNHQIELINQFLKLSPRLKQFGDARVRTEPQEDLSFKSSKIKKSLASENLAIIFLRQGKVKKAIKIYEHLITKFPEKKAYFADQIEKLKHLS